MSVTYPTEMLPIAEDGDDIDIIVGGEIYRWRDGQWKTDSGKPLSAEPMQ